jgi:hypothetical protein
MTVAPQYGTSGSKLKKSLGEARADIHGHQKEEEERNRMTGFSLSPHHVLKRLMVLYSGKTSTNQSNPDTESIILMTAICK